MYVTFELTPSRALLLTNCFHHLPRLAGNLGSIGTSAIISFTTSYLWPAHYDFVGTHNLNAADHADEIKATLPIDEEMADGKVSDNKEDPGAVTTATPHSELEDSAPYDENKDPVKLAAAFRFSVIASLTALFVLIILVSTTQTSIFVTSNRTDSRLCKFRSWFALPPRLLFLPSSPPADPSPALLQPTHLP